MTRTVGSLSKNIMFAFNHVHFKVADYIIFLFGFHFRVLSSDDLNNRLGWCVLNSLYTLKRLIVRALSSIVIHARLILTLSNAMSYFSILNLLPRPSNNLVGVSRVSHLGKLRLVTSVSYYLDGISEGARPRSFGFWSRTRLPLLLGVVLLLWERSLRPSVHILEQQIVLILYFISNWNCRLDISSLFIRVCFKGSIIDDLFGDIPFEFKFLLG